MKKKAAAVIIIVISLTVTLFGIYRGEPKVVMKKAINICMECIGIG